MLIATHQCARLRFLVGTTNGLLEFSGTELSAIHKCRTSGWDPFEGHVIDKSGGKLWTRNGRNSTLIGYDGTKWLTFPLATLPHRSEYTRIDDLSLISGGNVKDKFYLQMGSHIWNVTNGDKFEEVNLPAMRCEYKNPDRVIDKGCFHTIATTSQSLYVIARADYVSNAIDLDRSAIQDAQSDVVAHIKNGVWEPLKNSLSTKLVSKLILSGTNAVYIITYSNEVFKLEGDSVLQLESIGSIQSATLASDDSLVVLVAGVGVFKMTDTWKQAADFPPVKGELISDTFIAEQNGVLSIAVNFVADAPGEKIHAEVWQYENNEYKRILPAWK